MYISGVDTSILARVTLQNRRICCCYSDSQGYHGTWKEKASERTDGTNNVSVSLTRGFIRAMLTTARPHYSADCECELQSGMHEKNTVIKQSNEG